MQQAFSDGTHRLCWLCAARCATGDCGALRFCRKTAELAELAQSRWTTASHAIFPDAQRRSAAACMLVGQRLAKTMAAAPMAQDWLAVLQYAMARDSRREGQVKRLGPRAAATRDCKGWTPDATWLATMTSITSTIVVSDHGELLEEDMGVDTGSLMVGESFLEFSQACKQMDRLSYRCGLSHWYTARQIPAPAAGLSGTPGAWGPA